MDRHRRFQRADASRLYSAADGALARQHRNRLRAADRLGSKVLPRGTRVRLLNSYQARWQYAGEALGFGFAQGKPCCGGARSSKGRRHRSAWRGDRRGRRRHQADPPRRPLRPSRRLAIRTAAGAAPMGRGLGAAAPFGAAATRNISAAVRAGAPDDRSIHLDRRFFGAAQFGAEPFRRARAGRPRLVRVRSGAGQRRRLAPELVVGPSRHGARPRSAVSVGASLGQRRFRWRGDGMSVAEDDAGATRGANGLPKRSICRGRGASQTAKSSYVCLVVNKLKGGDPVSHCQSPRVMSRAWVIVRAEKDRA